jgi:hypothetical protein
MHQPREFDFVIESTPAARALAVKLVTETDLCDSRRLPASTPADSRPNWRRARRQARQLPKLLADLEAGDSSGDEQASGDAGLGRIHWDYLACPHATGARENGSA